MSREALTLLPAYTLWRREIVRFMRQRSRIIGVIASPIIFWLFLGSGFGSSFKATGADGLRAVSYLEYFYPGTIVLTVLFTCIFSSISVIEDRQEGFLQGALAAPVTRAGIALGKVFGSATFAGIQGIILLLLAPTVGLGLGADKMLAAAIAMGVTAFGMAGLGFAFAWVSDSTQGFHAIMNLLLVPMWMLSGSVFPVSGAPWWLQGVMRANPLLYCTEAVRGAFYEGFPALGSAAFLISVLFGAASFVAAYVIVKKEG
jgi:ABC-2 type transport system permease protein